MINIVRLELCGAVVSKRLREFVCKEVDLNFERVIHLVDSEIVKTMINILHHYYLDIFRDVFCRLQ